MSHRELLVAAERLGQGLEDSYDTARVHDTDRGDLIQFAYYGDLN